MVHSVLVTLPSRPPCRVASEYDTCCHIILSTTRRLLPLLCHTNTLICISNPLNCNHFWTFILLSSVMSCVPRTTSQSRDHGFYWPSSAWMQTHSMLQCHLAHLAPSPDSEATTSAPAAAHALSTIQTIFAWLVWISVHISAPV